MSIVFINSWDNLWVPEGADLTDIKANGNTWSRRSVKVSESFASFTIGVPLILFTFYRTVDDKDSGVSG